MTKDGAIARAEGQGFKVTVVGNGEKVISQSPAIGTEIDKRYGVIILYTGDAEAESETVEVPDLIGKPSVAANTILVNYGLNVRIEGANAPNVSASNMPIVVKQSIAPNTEVPKGTVVTIEFRYMDKDEEADYMN